MDPNIFKPIQFYCTFCHQACSTGMSPWWDCKPCKTKFYHDTSLREIVFKIPKDDFEYELSLQITSNRTVVYRAKNPQNNGTNIIWHFPEKILEIPTLIQNVSPQNAEQKLATILTFS